MNENGWIKLYSKFRHWKWYKNQNTKDLFIHCLLKANWKDGNFEGVEIKRGSFVTSLTKLSEELNISIPQLRIAIKHLVSTGEIAQEKHSKFTVISIKNYDSYQVDSTVISKQLAEYQHRISRVLATIEEYKNIDINIKERIYNACTCVREENLESKTKIEVFDYDWLDEEGG